MTAKRWVALGIATALFFFYVVGQVATNFFFKDNMLLQDYNLEWQEEVYQQGGLDRIALLEVDGVIIDQPSGDIFNPVGYNHRSFLKQIEHAFKDKNIKGIVLRVNSPGGGVVESDEIYHKITEMKEKYKKPIVAYMANMAASGGYYISAPTDKIFANRSTLTGSIGVIISSYNVQELAENWGVKQEVIKSGPHKDIMSTMREMTDEERNIIQSIVDESYENFLNVVVEGREDVGMTKEKLRPLADGRIFTGQQAKKAGLIDGIGFMDDAIKETADLAGINNPTVITYKQTGWPAFNQLFATFQGSSKDLLGIKELMHKQHQPSLMYLFKW
jgi:protease-4